MKRLAASFLAFSLVVVPTADVSFWRGSNPNESIRHMSAVQERQDGTKFRWNHCTAFAIKTSGGQKWASAAHCVTDMQGIQIGGHEAVVIAVDTNIDIAILDGAPAPGLTIAPRAPQVSDMVIVIGFPFGWDEHIYRTGIYSANYDVREIGVPLAITEIPLAPGDSGSPLLNSHFQVIGVVQAVFCDGIFTGFCPMSASAELKDLKYLLSTIGLR